MRTFLLFIVGLIAVLVIQDGALAHAFLDHADPKVGAVLSQPPTQIKIWFTQELEPAFSSVQVLDGNGTEVDKKDCHQDEKDKTLLIVSVPALAAGTYKVAWKVVSVDTHHTQGDFKFTVKAAN
ncbi:MAG: copper resistance CopC family protein [Tepidisphaeraceae bacterium]|jgi:methionine-rich copper-binding protein CopC